MVQGNKKFLNKESEAIRKHKWILSEAAKRDLGEFASADWIAKYAKVFREIYCTEEIKAGVRHIDLAIKKEKDKSNKSRLMVIRRCMVESLSRREHGKKEASRSRKL